MLVPSPWWGLQHFQFQWYRYLYYAYIYVEWYSVYVYDILCICNHIYFSIKLVHQSLESDFHYFPCTTLTTLTCLSLVIVLATSIQCDGGPMCVPRAIANPVWCWSSVSHRAIVNPVWVWTTASRYCQPTSTCLWCWFRVYIFVELLSTTCSTLCNVGPVCPPIALIKNVSPQPSVVLNRCVAYLNPVWCCTIWGL